MFRTLLAVGVLCACLNSVSAAPLEKSFTLRSGVSVRFRSESFTPPVAVTVGAATQNEAISSLIRYYSALGQGDIPGAARLTFHPAAAEKTLGSYLQRSGAQAFKSGFQQMLGGQLKAETELTLGNAKALILKNGSAQSAQFFVLKGRQLFMDDSVESVDCQKLGEIFQAIQEQKLKL